MKGKQRWLTNDDDLIDMYSTYGKRIEVILWCRCVWDSGAEKRPAKKRRHESENASDEPTSTSKKAKIMKNISEVEIIMKDLQKKHQSSFTTEQFSTWAHMLHTGKHSSYDVPPQLPFFTGKVHKQVQNIEGGPSPKADSPHKAVGVSPGKRVSLRTECISQLDKWHSLLQKKCITQVEYDELRTNILKDVLNM